MNGNQKYWLWEAYRHLELALIGIRKKNREHINAAIDCLERYEQELKEKK